MSASISTPDAPASVPQRRVPSGVHTNCALTIPPFPENPLMRRLDRMIETLVAKGLARYEHADPFRGLIERRQIWGAFILIPPRPKDLDFSALLKLIPLQSGKAFTNTLNERDIIDTPDLNPKVPSSGPYVLSGIEDGRNRLSIDPYTSHEGLKNVGCSPYTVYEGIIHAILFPEVASSHDFHLVGSRYKSHFCMMPVLLFGRDGENPCLTAIRKDGPEPHRGIPSCNRRVDVQTALGVTATEVQIAA